MSTTMFAAFNISFSPSWVLSKREDTILPVDRFTFELKKKFTISDVDANLTDCSGVIEIPENSDLTSLQKEIDSILTELFRIPKGNEIYTLTLSPYEKPDEENAPADRIPTVEEILSIEAPVKERKGVKNAGRSKNRTCKEESCTEQILKQINRLVAACEFKELADECIKIAPHIKKFGTYDAFTHRSYLVSINDGYGLTTYLNLFADLIEELGLFTFTTKNRVAEVTLLPPQKKSPMDSPFSAALSHFQRSGGRIICIDISEWMTETDEKEFRDFLKTIDLHAGENIVFFRVPFVEKSVLMEIHANLNDQLFVRDFSIIPFDAGELDTCALAMLQDIGFTMDDAAWEIFRERIAEEKNDGRFYGINTVRKVVLEMIYLKQLHDAAANSGNNQICGSEITKLVSVDSGYNRTGMQMLRELVGMEQIQQRVEEIVAQIEASLQNKELGSPCIHMRFVGNPGTGKTTVARIIGKILKEKGILRNGSFFEYSGRDFCGRYVGETAPKTASICRDAYGSVLFIDEAYSLYRDDAISTADYGREAIDTLVAEMENHRTDLVIIMAGYPDEMDKLMNGNVGLKSRMPYQIDFPNYSREQLSDIFLGMAEKSFTFANGFEDALRRYFNTLAD